MLQGSLLQRIMGTRWAILISVFVTVFITRALRVGNVRFDPFNIEIWMDSKKFYLKGYDENLQPFLLDGQQIIPLPETVFLYHPLHDTLHNELSFKSFLTFFENVPGVQWSDLIDEIPVDNGNLLFGLPGIFWKSLKREEYARLWDKFSGRPDFQKLISNFLSPNLVGKSVVMVRAEYPGRITAYKGIGDQLKSGENLITIECMKTNFNWSAQAPLTVEFMFFDPMANYSVKEGQLLYLVRYH